MKKILFSIGALCAGLMLLWSNDHADPGSFLGQHSSLIALISIILVVFGALGIAVKALQKL